MAFSIRKATSDDAEPVGRLLAEVFAATYGPAIPADILEPYLAREFAPATLARDLARPGACHLLAEAAGAVAAVARLEPQPPPDGCHLPDSGELVKLYVGAGYQGRGVGAYLLAHALDQARELGWRAIWLAVWKRNPRAVAFYRRHGFGAIGRVSVFVDWVEFDDLVMSRGLE